MSIMQNLCFRTDHAAVIYAISCKQSAVTLAQKANDLGKSVLPKPPCKPILSMSNIDRDKFMADLPDPSPFWSLPHLHDAETAASFVTDSIYTAALAARVKPTPAEYATSPPDANHRWKNIISSHDSRSLWKSINWNGTFKDTPDETSCPSDIEFGAYFTELLNDPAPTPLIIPPTNVSVPELDCDIEPHEVDKCIKDLKADKAAGVDGIPPGVYKLLSDEWLLVITFMFNLVFSGVYPLQWAIARMFMIFKKNDRFDPANYRGISIITAIAKIYDMVLNNRLMKWYSPSLEQSGAQKGRSCDEQILVVRLLIDIARKSGLPLFFGAIDFQKAYDWVCRTKLLQMLADARCGKRFLNAIGSALSCTLSRIGTCEFSSTKGVRQGSPTSCFLFTFYVDCLIKAIKATGDDGWLQSLHCLMQMDDTLVFATSRDKFVEKLTVSKVCSDELKQAMHPVKSKFLTCNVSDTADLQPIFLGSTKISHTELYVYLGTPLSNAHITDQVRNHILRKNGDKLKFFSFLAKNPNAPYVVKEKVWSCALNSAIYYSCTTWLGCDKRVLAGPYLQSLKSLLGIRMSTCTDVVYTEAGVPSAAAYVTKLQMVFLKRLYARPGFRSSYIGWAVQEAIRRKCTMGNAISKLLRLTTPPDNTDIHSSLLFSVSTKRVTYRGFNPELKRHEMYKSLVVPEYARISATRLRVASHNLRVETGRWQRLERKDRVCSCDGVSVQDETHSLLFCPNTANIRASFPALFPCRSVNELFEKECLDQVVIFCHRVINS